MQVAAAGTKSARAWVATAPNTTNTNTHVEIVTKRLISKSPIRKA